MGRVMMEDMRGLHHGFTEGRMGVDGQAQVGGIGPHFNSQGAFGNQFAGTAADLYVLLWNRTPDAGIAMSGKTDLMDLWHGNFRVRWG